MCVRIVTVDSDVPTPAPSVDSTKSPSPDGSVSGSRDLKPTNGSLIPSTVSGSSITILGNGGVAKVAVVLKAK